MLNCSTNANHIWAMHAKIVLLSVSTVQLAKVKFPHFASIKKKKNSRPTWSFSLSQVNYLHLWNTFVRLKAFYRNAHKRGQWRWCIRPMKHWEILAAEFKVVSAVLEAGSKSKRLHTGGVFLGSFLILCHSSFMVLMKNTFFPLCVDRMLATYQPVL